MLARRFLRISKRSFRSYAANCAMPWSLPGRTREAWARGEYGDGGLLTGAAYRESIARGRGIGRGRGIDNGMAPRSETPNQLAKRIGYETGLEAGAKGWSRDEAIDVARRRVEIALGRRINWAAAEEDPGRPARRADCAVGQSERGELSTTKHRSPPAVSSKGGLRDGAAGRWA